MFTILCCALRELVVDILTYFPLRCNSTTRNMDLIATNEPVKADDVPGTRFRFSDLPAEIRIMTFQDIAWLSFRQNDPDPHFIWTTSTNSHLPAKRKLFNYARGSPNLLVPLYICRANRADAIDCIEEYGIDIYNKYSFEGEPLPKPTFLETPQCNSVVGREVLPFALLYCPKYLANGTHFQSQKEKREACCTFCIRFTFCLSKIVGFIS